MAEIASVSDPLFLCAFPSYRNSVASPQTRRIAAYIGNISTIAARKLRENNIYNSADVWIRSNGCIEPIVTQTARYWGLIAWGPNSGLDVRITRRSAQRVAELPTSCLLTSAETGALCPTLRWGESPWSYFELRELPLFRTNQTMTAVSAEEGSLSSEQSWSPKAELSFTCLNASSAGSAFGPTKVEARRSPARIL